MAKALSDLIEDDFLTVQEGKELSEKIFRENAKMLYHI